MLKTLAVKENNMSSKFATPFLKKSPLLGAYENAADGKAFMGGLVTGQEQFAKLQQDITKGFDNYMEGEGTQQRLEKDSQDKINSMNIGETQGKGKNEKTIKQKDIDSAQKAHNSRFNKKTKTEREQDKEKVLDGTMTLENYNEKYNIT